MGLRIQIVVQQEDGSLHEITMPEKANNEIDIYLLDDNDKIIDKKTLLLADKHKIEFV